MGGDNWEADEVPLGEDEERYEVDILDGAGVKRTLSATVPMAIYSEADQIADWGAVQSSYQVNVYQMSTTFGRGAARLATI